jgi:hypothetical protein
VVKLKRSKKRHAVRMLEHAFRLAVRRADNSMSGLANGRLASDLQKDIRLLRELLLDDPENLFWETLQKAIYKLVKFIGRTR